MKHQFNNVSFHFRLFPGKCKFKVFEKIKKNYFGGILSPFCQNLGKNEFFWKKGLWSVFKYSNYLPPCKKSGKTNDPFLRKMPNWPTNRRTDNGDFIGLFIERGSKKAIQTKKYTQDKVHPFMTRKNWLWAMQQISKKLRFQKFQKRFAFLVHNCDLSASSLTSLKFKSFYLIFNLTPILVSSIFIYFTKRKHFKNSEKAFHFSQKTLFVLKIFKFLNIPLPLFFPLLAKPNF